MKFTEKQEIESFSFAARANVASDLDTFLEAIKAEPSVLSLQNRLQENPSMTDALVKEIEYLCDLEFDEQYANPHDTVVATYGWILTNVDSVNEYIAIDLLCKLKNSVWSGRLAERLLEQSRDKALTWDPFLKLFSQCLNTSVTTSVLRSYVLWDESRKQLDTEHSQGPYSDVNPMGNLVESQMRPRRTVYQKIQANLERDTKQEGIDTSSLTLILSSHSDVNFCGSVLKKYGGWPAIPKPSKDQDSVSFHRPERLVA
ncbi:MAG: hypothetical protein F4227_02780 [Gammaproteobacteria bacterium]|nr:hypothetical protein [Gammaproteobacteria bacterium]MYF01922.1 hypothetical protein [Gammaproteobacteria bacterium]MYI76817.1 hypothetical protein [Gammaproteobacteria bacterium]